MDSYQTANEPQLGFGGVLTVHARRAPDRVALSEAGERELTYAEWERRSHALAGVLLRRAAKGQRIALTFSDMDWIEYAVAYLAVLKAGCVAVHLGSHLPADEYGRRAAECLVEGTIHTAGLTPAAVRGWAASVAELEQHAEGAPHTADVGPGDEAEIIYSSATTGRGTGVIATHANLMHWCSPENLADPGTNESRLTVAPLSTGGSAVVINNLLTSPTTYTLILSPPDPERVAALVAAHSVGTLLIAPWIAIQMVRDQVHRRHDLGAVHTIGTGASPTPPAIAERLLAMMPGAKLLVSYSGSQMRPAAVLGTFNPDRPFAVGRGVGKTEFMIVGPAGVATPDWQVGEIYMRSDAPPRNYVGERPTGLLQNDGWTASGDLGYVGSDGELYFFDRKADAILRNGKLTSSVVVESMLYATSGISEAAVVELVEEGATYGAVVAAVVADSDSAVERARDVLASAFPQEQQPVRAIRLPSLPRDVLGKVRKRELKELLRTMEPATDATQTMTFRLPFPPVGLPPAARHWDTSPAVNGARNGVSGSGRAANGVAAEAPASHVPAHRAGTVVASARVPAARRDTDGPTAPERDELAALRRENQQLRQDLEALKRALAVFTRGMP